MVKKTKFYLFIHFLKRLHKIVKKNDGWAVELYLNVPKFERLVKAGKNIPSRAAIFSIVQSLNEKSAYKEDSLDSYKKVCIPLVRLRSVYSIIKSNYR
jgi:hypothetical protein